MTILYDVDRDLRLVYARPEAEITAETLRDHFQALAQDPAVGAGFGEVLDLTDTTTCAVNVPQLYGLVEVLQIHPSRLQRLAIACRDRDVLPRLLLLQELAKVAPVEIGVFQQLASAAAWVSVRHDQIERVALARSNH